MNDRFQAKLISGGHKGTEAEFGRNAELWQIDELTISYEGHSIARAGGRTEVLSDADLARGDVSMEIVFQRLGRTFARGKGIRRVIQSMFHIVTRGDHLFAVGWIQDDNTIKGGTGWGVELAKFFNREVSVFDQDKGQWFTWTGGQWQADEPTIPQKPFAATGTRTLTDAGQVAIRQLFERSFGDAPEA
ncbi:MAG: hypothetical protein AAF657_20455 [Acidobacteriota bacterium]